MPSPCQRPRIRPTRADERMRLCSAVRIERLDGTSLEKAAVCRELGLGGMRVVGSATIAPGTAIQFALHLPRGRRLLGLGRIAWLKTTIHPKLLGVPRGATPESEFGVAFEGFTPEALLPIARLFHQRQAERQRAIRWQHRRGLRLLA